MSNHLRGLRSQLLTAPTVEPITVAEVKSHIRLDTEVDDAYISNTLIPSAREMIEAKTGRALITQTWEAVFDNFPRVESCEDDEWWDGVRQGVMSSATRRDIALPVSRLQSILSFETRSADDVLTLVDPSVYRAVTGDYGALHIREGQAMPIPKVQYDAFRVVYSAGYGDTPSDVPPPLRRAVLVLAGAWYEDREGMNHELPDGVNTTIGSYIRRRI